MPRHLKENNLTFHGESWANKRQFYCVLSFDSWLSHSLTHLSFFFTVNKVQTLSHGRPLLARISPPLIDLMTGITPNIQVFFFNSIPLLSVSLSLPSNPAMVIDQASPVLHTHTQLCIKTSLIPRVGFRKLISKLPCFFFFF